MKLHGKTVVLVPWFDSTGMKHWVRMQFNGTMDMRKFYSIVINYIKKEFGTTVSKQWVKTQCPMMNEFDSNAPKITDAQFKESLEAWLQEMQADADKDESDPVSQTGDNETTGQQVLPV